MPCRGGELTGEEMFIFSAKGIFDGVVGQAAFFASSSMRLRVLRIMSNALRRSPVCDATFFAQNCMAEGAMSGGCCFVVASSAVGGRRELSFLVITDTICGTV